MKINKEERGCEIQKRNSGINGGDKHGGRHRRAGSAERMPEPCLRKSNEPRPAGVPNPSSHQYQGCGRQRHAEHRAEHHQLERQRRHPPSPGGSRPIRRALTHAEAGRTAPPPARREAAAPGTCCPQRPRAARRRTRCVPGGLFQSRVHLI